MKANRNVMEPTPITADTAFELVHKLIYLARTTGKKPRFLVAGGEKLARLEYEAQESCTIEHRYQSQDRKPVSFMGLQIVRVDRDTLEVGS